MGTPLIAQLAAAPAVGEEYRPYALSPDGSRVAFEWYKGGDWQIHVMDLPDGEPRRVGDLRDRCAAVFGAALPPAGATADPRVVRDALLAVAAQLRARHGARVHLYTRGPEEARFFAAWMTAPATSRSRPTVTRSSCGSTSPPSG